jgi:hypothetical protein
VWSLVQMVWVGVGGKFHAYLYFLEGFKRTLGRVQTNPPPSLAFFQLVHQKQRALCDSELVISPQTAGGTAGGLVRNGELRARPDPSFWLTSHNAPVRS